MEGADSLSAVPTQVGGWVRRDAIQRVRCIHATTKLWVVGEGGQPICCPYAGGGMGG